MSTMDDQQLEKIICAGFDLFDKADKKKLSQAVTLALDGLDQGRLRVAEKKQNQWITHAWLKKAILLSFRFSSNKLVRGGFDKVPLKFENWDENQFTQAKLRAVPGSIVRRGSFIGKNVVLMPSFVNIGAYVDDGVMVDSWSTIGSAAQIGKRVHISGGVGIGGVLEPVQAQPVIIEDDCFIGARCEIAEGVVVRQGSVLAMGVFLSASTKILDRESGHIYQGEVPPYSVVVSGTLPSQSTTSNQYNPNLYCAVIVKRVDARTRSKTSINELLRQA